jgi:glutamate racemase
MNRLGILDWGIGGISIYKLVKERLGIPVVYFSDTGATPYGKMARFELASRLDTVIAFLKSRGMTHLVIGCNAASTVIPDLRDQEIVVEGMIDNAIAAALSCKPSRLGVIGGRRTILSGVYRKGLSDRQFSVEQRIAQPLSGLIESGDVSSDNLRREAERIMRPIRNCSHILLACTHYPAIAAVLKELVSPKTEFIDPAALLVEKISGWKLETGGKDEFFTSGDPKSMKRSAKLAFGVGIKSISTVRP